jgi:DNA-binding transcriptional ArsR family regulator
MTDPRKFVTAAQYRVFKYMTDEWVTVETIAFIAGVSESTTRRQLEALTKLGNVDTMFDTNIGRRYWRLKNG